MFNVHLPLAHTQFARNLTAGLVAVNLTNILLPYTRFLLSGAGLLELKVARRAPVSSTPDQICRRQAAPAPH